MCEYAHLSIYEVQDMDYIDYLTLRKDAFIYRCKQTEEGRKYLKNAYRLKLTQPDTDTLRKKFGKEVNK